MNRRKFNLLIKALVVAVVLFLIAIVIIVLGKKEMDKKNASINELASEIESNRQIVYVVKDKRIEKGEVLYAEGEDANVMKQEIYSGLEPDYYITDEDIGSVAIVNMDPQTPIMKNMVTTISITHDTREYEIGAVNLMADQMVNDFIDVRIMFPNGEDYLVLSKKKVIKQVLETSLVYTYMNEEEILRYASAVVDAYTTTGAYLYTTRYVESNIQNEAVPNYLVKANVIDLMVSDPNIVSIAQNTLNLEARMNLEQKLSGLTEEQLAAVAEGHGIQDTAKTSVLLNRENYTIVNGDADSDSNDRESGYHPSDGYPDQDDEKAAQSSETDETSAMDDEE